MSPGGGWCRDGDYIGKEANNIEGELFDGGNVQVFRNIEKEKQKILSMRQCDEDRDEIDRKTR